MAIIALACDHGGFELMTSIREYLDRKSYAYKDFGVFENQKSDYPEVAVLPSKAIVSGECNKGIFICGTGIGISIAANKIPGIRAAVCTNVFMAEMARAHNNANVLALGGRVIDSALAIDIVEMFLNTSFSDEERHHHRVDLLRELDNLRACGGEEKK